jgi:hypothetical protein
MPRGGARKGSGPKPRPLAELRRAVSVTLSLTAIEAVRERALPGEPFSTTLDRILNALPSPSLPASTPPTMT